VLLSISEFNKDIWFLNETRLETIYDNYPYSASQLMTYESTVDMWINSLNRIDCEMWPESFDENIFVDTAA
jgi:hypothetical protein